MTGRVVLGAALACVAGMVMPGVASAGGFSTVGLTSPPPVDLKAGEAWDVRFTLLGHGRTPMTRMKPVVRIRPMDGGDARTIRATDTGDPGTYGARVVFPAEGRWTIEVAESHVLDQGHAFGQVHVAEAGAGEVAGSSRGGLGSPAVLVIALALGLLAGAGAWLSQRGPGVPRSTVQSG